ncbi:hypothetical protein NQ176_g10645 [Zarea fungicola]|uniref:Uncharacterized protein n=1 Tax=Zarea fungicola TaxID=93591 RepID=A0ACC1MEN5_9HYPO|nr:hypothetical protein NQ176_g10645 [Lecanicillium fungicola]
MRSSIISVALFISGTCALFRASVESVREEMRRPLDPGDMELYRGITSSGKTGVFYDRLWGVKTTEELIIAENYGTRMRPSDEGNAVYLFSPGRGLVASLNPSVVSNIERQVGSLNVADKTLEELKESYLSADVPKGDHEKLLNEVAEDFILWSSGSNGLELRRTEYCATDDAQCT